MINILYWIYLHKKGKGKGSRCSLFQNFTIKKFILTNILIS